jgi:hypothetical protein
VYLPAYACTCIPACMTACLHDCLLSCLPACLCTCRYHAALSVQVHIILKSIVTNALNSPDCRDLARFANLKSEIVTNAAKTLGVQPTPP